MILIYILKKLAPVDLSSPTAPPLSLRQIERERGQLISQTFKELNTQYNNCHRRGNQTTPPLVVNRVKVHAKGRAARAGRRNELLAYILITP